MFCGVKFILFFFFQAEDGIRDIGVTGVQTCALPICRTASFTMYGQDWPIEAGHRIGVLLSSANTDEFQHVATRQAVTVRSAKIALPFLTYDRTEFLDGESTPRLESYLSAATARLSETAVAAA